MSGTIAEILHFYSLRVRDGPSDVYLGERIPTTLDTSPLSPDAAMLYAGPALCLNAFPGPYGTLEDELRSADTVAVENVALRLQLVLHQKCVLWSSRNRSCA